jgi:hypothetical protein
MKALRFNSTMDDKQHIAQGAKPEKGEQVWVLHP